MDAMSQLLVKITQLTIQNGSLHLFNNPDLRIAGVYLETRWYPQHDQLLVTEVSSGQLCVTDYPRDDRHGMWKRATTDAAWRTGQ